MPMPQKKRRRRRRKSSPGGSSRPRLGEHGGSPVEADINSTDPGADGGASSTWYQSLLASKLDALQLPRSDDDDADDDDPGSFDSPDPPSGEILETLTRRSFLDNQMLDALVEYQVQKCLSEGRRDSGEIHSADVAMVSVDKGVEILEEEFFNDLEKLWSRRTEVDEDTELDEQQRDELYLRHALFRIKAVLLLKGKAIDKLDDDAALERKYPPELIKQHNYLLDYEGHDAFGWYFDSKLCRLASLTDYQRLVLFNQFGDEYDNWSRYCSHYNTPETDREYLLYWEAISEQLKWIEGYIHIGRISDEWRDMRMKASYQAIRIATGFDNIHHDLACLGFEEFLWRTQTNVLYLKDLGGVFFELWKLVIKEKIGFKMALKKVHDMRRFPSREGELNGKFSIEEEFRCCTVGITEEVPEYKAWELIALQIKHKLVVSHGYEQYAAKKLKVAEYIGLIRKTPT